MFRAPRLRFGVSQNQLCVGTSFVRGKRVSFGRRKFTVNKVTGASKKAFEDVMDPTVPRNIFELFMLIFGKNNYDGIYFTIAGIILNVIP